MPINPSNMRVVDVARLLNSTSFGFVLAQARLYRAQAAKLEES